MKGLLLSSIALTIICLTMSVKCQEFSLDDLEGRYVMGSEVDWTFKTGAAKKSWDMSSNLVLSKDGTYSAGNDCEMTDGKYSYSNGVVTLKVGKPRYSHCFYSIVITKENEELLKNPPPPKDTVVYPVRWSERIYLIEQNGWGDFVNAINIGLLPQTAHEHDLFMGFFYSKIGDEEKPTRGFPDLPPEWRGKLLQNTVTAKIVAVRKVNDSEYYFSIDKGSKAGLLRDMKMLIGNDPPSLFGNAFIQSVSIDSAELMAFREIKVGETVTSRFVRPTQ